MTECSLSGSTPEFKMGAKELGFLKYDVTLKN